MKKLLGKKIALLGVTIMMLACFALPAAASGPGPIDVSATTSLTLSYGAVFLSDIDLENLFA